MYVYIENIHRKHTCLHTYVLAIQYNIVQYIILCNILYCTIFYCNHHLKYDQQFFRLHRLSNYQSITHPSYILTYTCGHTIKSLKQYFSFL